MVFWNKISAEFREFSTQDARGKLGKLLSAGYKEMIDPDEGDRRNFKVFFKVSECTYNQAYNKDLAEKRKRTKDPKSGRKPKCEQEYFLDEADLTRNNLKKVPKLVNGIEEWRGIIPHLSILKESLAVEAHIKLLFRDDAKDKIREDFRNRVKQITNAYFNGRKALRGLFKRSMDFLQIINSPPISRKILDFNRHELTGHISRFCSQIIGTRYLLGAIDIAKTSRSNFIVKLAKQLEREVAEDLPKNFLNDARNTDRREWNRSKIYRQLDEALALALMSDPLTITRALIKVDNEFINSPPTIPLHYSKGQNRGEPYPYFDNLYFPVYRSFGVVRNLVEIDTKTFQSAFKLVSEVTSGAGLERGRLEKGLHSLIEDYSIVRFGSSGTSKFSKERKETQKELDRLLNDLVHFAQKVLFVANYSSLMEPPNRSDKRIKVYTRVLQAVGNSILVQVDALRQEEAHHQVLVDGKEREIRAIERAYVVNSTKFFDEIVKTITSDLPTVDEKLNELTVKLANITDELIKAAKKKNSAKTALTATKGEVTRTKPLDNYKDKLTRFADVRETLYKDGAVVSAIQVLENDTNLVKANLMAQIVDVVRDEETQEVNKSGNALTSRALRLANTLQLLELSAFQTEIGPLVASSADKKDFVENKLKKHLERKHAEEKKIVLRKDEAFTIARNKQTAAQTKFDTAEKNHNDLMAQKVPIEQAKAKKAARKAELDQAKQAIKPLRQKVLDSVESAEVSPTGTAVVSQLLGFLQAGLNKETDPNSNTAKLLKNAIKVVEQLPHPSTTPPVRFTKDPKDAKEVWDDLIAFLRQVHLRAVRKFGVGSEPSEKAAATLKTALAHRSGFIYLRPAMAYLRTSFPATSLQEDAPLAWKNMLSEHGLHQLPFASSSEKQSMQTQLDIDKQFWQNVNTVRVAGAGNTNYVVAKDDVGNWYVKEMAADPSDIFRSMGNLALFGMGPGLNPGLLSGGPISPSDNPLTGSPIDRGSGGSGPGGIGTTPQGNTTSPGSNSDRPVTAFEKQFKLFDERYRKNTAQDHQKLKEAIAGLKGKIEKGWKENPKTNQFEGDLLGAMSSQTPSIEEPKDPQIPETDPDLGTKLLKALKAIKEFETQVVNNISQGDVGKLKNFESKLAEVKATQQKKESLANRAKTEESDAQVRFKKSQDVVSGLKSELQGIGDPVNGESEEVKEKRARTQGRLEQAEKEETAEKLVLDNSRKEVQRTAEELALVQKQFIEATTNAEAGRTGQRIVVEVISGSLKSFLSRRATVVNEYRAALTVINQSVGN